MPDVGPGYRLYAGVFGGGACIVHLGGPHRQRFLAFAVGSRGFFGVKTLGLRDARSADIRNISL